MRAIITRPTAVPELDTLVASARIATSPIQSPRLETTCAIHRRMKPGTRNTDRDGGIGCSSGVDGDERRLLAHAPVSLGAGIPSYAAG